MNTTVLSIAFCFVVLMVGATNLSAQPQTINSFSWLIGQWSNINDGSVEEWTLSENGESLIGRVYSLKDGVEKQLESLQISYDNAAKKWYYTATVSHNPAPVKFEIVKIEPNALKAVNKKHDFPTDIEYKRDATAVPDRVTAKVSNAKKTLTFEFVRWLR